jgi:uncharacterized protein YndB with AHSA1/START domain
MNQALKQSATITLQGDTDFLITREFDAPRELVWRAVTEPELVERWFHANRADGVTATADLRVGGTWRYESRLPDGSSMAFYGQYKEIDEPNRIVTTEVFEPFPEAGSVNTMTLKDLGNGRTLLTVLVQHSAAEHRTAQLESGMEAGMHDAYDLLEDVATSLA